MDRIASGALKLAKLSQPEHGERSISTVHLWFQVPFGSRYLKINKLREKWAKNAISEK